MNALSLSPFRTFSLHFSRQFYRFNISCHVVQKNGAHFFVLNYVFAQGDLNIFAKGGRRVLLLQIQGGLDCVSEQFVDRKTISLWPSDHFLNDFIQTQEVLRCQGKRRLIFILIRFKIKVLEYFDVKHCTGYFFLCG
jgi:hypothetical protein